ncbi:MAG TPA: glycosyltransferase [Vicinamibacterales bacterium]|nr:glycosyltransferase [Vicinamibacterales bacterium]
MRITSDVHGLERVARSPDSVHAFSAVDYPGGWNRRLRLLFSALESDHLVLHFALPDVLLFSTLLTLLPFHRCRLTTLDFFVGELAGARLFAVRWALRRVHRCLVYFKDTSVFERLLHVPPSKFRYIPFKINAQELIANARSRDDGYIFCGGHSRRDFATFFAAVESLHFPVKMITSTEAEMKPHGSSLAGLAVPSNVEIFTRDRSAEFFVRTMAAARLVVIPLVADSTTQAGIGVCLQALALGKCVVVSTSRGISDVLSGREAIIVPAGDVDALRTAIRRAWDNPTVREQYGAAGKRYALPLGGEDELRRSILAALE